MPRIARVVATGYPHHITQRGNYKQKVFTSNKDYKFYLEHLNRYQCRYSLSILAYCLMPNHVHFVAVPKKEHSLAKTLNVCHMRYAHYFNKKNNLTGHLWQGRFYSCILDDKHLYAAIRYVENNPVRAGLVKKAGEWKWSSAKEHLGGEKGLLSLGDIYEYIEINNWKSYLSQKEDERIMGEVRKNTLTGRPSGSDMFIAKLEKIFGKRLKALPRGRPKGK